jgi:hypothetical protein
VIEAQQCPQDRLLRRVTRHIKVAEHPPTARDQRRVVAVHQLSESDLIAETRRSHQTLISQDTKHLQK